MNEQNPNPLDKKAQPDWLHRHQIAGYVFLAVIFAAAVSWMYFADSYRRSINTDFPIRQEIKTDEIKDWKTYRNDEYGFELKYPQGWSVDEQSQKNYVIFISAEKFNDMKDLAYEGFAGDLMFNNQSYFKSSSVSPQSKKIGDNIFSTYVGGEVYESPNYELVNNNKVYRFESASDFNDPLINKILSTFRIVDSKPVSDAKLKTHTNTGLGYEFSYPSDWSVSSSGDHYLYVGKDVDKNIYNDVPLQIDLACIYATEGVPDPITETNTVKYGNKTYKESKVYWIENGKKRLAFDFVSFDLPKQHVGQFCSVGNFIISPTSNREKVDQVISSFKFTK